MDPRHSRITSIALQAIGGYGFALAGGYAVSAHGMGDRLSSDVDLFTDWPSRSEFPTAVDAAIAALEQHGYAVHVVTRFETFARLLLTESDEPDSEPEKLELSADWRAHPPVMSEIGPVLHPDDAVANKMCALYGRAEARDFLDVDAALQSGRYSRERLLELAAASDTGFDREIFSGALSALEQTTDSDFQDYGLTADQLTAMRRRFAEWRTALRAPTIRP
ncbi:nucleotidyl transferase AbiEii/AbiGii toxin family protein [Actinoplanes sp. NPDC051851]|uniref:nucleotidyl transferase AbiEii/AbiGii toxin family protein n=1 Tax=Actinoplanes sp. NPDC051851 TaxID=3154753 RepID=UPI00341DAA7F